MQVRASVQRNETNVVIRLHGEDDVSPHLHNLRLMSLPPIRGGPWLPVMQRPAVS